MSELRKLRRLSGLTLAQAAKAIGVSAPTIWLAENNRHGLSSAKEKILKRVYVETAIRNGENVRDLLRATAD